MCWLGKIPEKLNEKDKLQNNKYSMNPLKEKMKNKKNLYIFVTYCIEKKNP